MSDYCILYTLLLFKIYILTDCDNKKKPLKYKICSFIVSAKSFLPGHKKRFNLLIWSMKEVMGVLEVLKLSKALGSITADNSIRRTSVFEFLIQGVGVGG